MKNNIINHPAKGENKTVNSRLPAQQNHPKRSINKSRSGRWDLSKTRADFDVPQALIYRRVKNAIQSVLDNRTYKEFIAGFFVDDLNRLTGEKTEDIIMVLHINGWSPRCGASFVTSKWYPPSPHIFNS